MIGHFFICTKIKFNMNIKTLSCCEKEKEYKILKINISNEKIKQQLTNLGFLENEKIKLLNHNYNKRGFLVKVMGVNYAIDKKICDKIEVYGE